jgi:ketosteroid isomerase-like protein
MNNEELEKRLKNIEDIEQIKILQNKYLYWLYDRQWDKIIDCFTEDATVEIGKHGLRKGRAEITKLFKQDINKTNAGKGRDGHFVVQPVISVEDDKATGQWLIYIMISDPVTGNAQRWVYGVYNCYYVKTNGKWKLSFLKVPANNLF